MKMIIVIPTTNNKENNNDKDDYGDINDNDYRNGSAMLIKWWS